MTCLVVGTGASGAMAARHLAVSGRKVIVFEAGPRFKPMTRRVRHVEPLRRIGLLGEERTITRLFPHLRTARSGNLVMVRGVGAGGCTALSCGNMMPTGRGLKGIGLDLDKEFREIGSMLHTCTVPRERWTRTTGRMFDVAEGMGMGPEPTTKVMDMHRCVSCGMCELGCVTGARWDSRTWLTQAIAHGTEVFYGNEVRKVLIERGRVVGVQALTPKGTLRVKADTVVLAAGGIGTAQILLRSGIQVSDTLWVDPVISIGGMLNGAMQLNEVPMAWYCREGDHMISPYLDLLSHFFHPSWRDVSVKDRVGVMIKLADSANGKVDVDGNITKVLTDRDEEAIAEATSIVEAIMSDAGVKGPFIRGMVNGGHLGGTFPLDPGDVPSMRSPLLPEGLWVADLSLVPTSQGGPTMMLAAAIALRISEQIIERSAPEAEGSGNRG